MQFRVLLSVVALVCACESAVAEPKAYEVAKYKGKADGVSIALDYGDGYPDASRDMGNRPQGWKEDTIRVGRQW